MHTHTHATCFNIELPYEKNKTPVCFIYYYNEIKRHSEKHFGVVVYNKGIELYLHATLTLQKNVSLYVYNNLLWIQWRKKCYSTNRQKKVDPQYKKKRKFELFARNYYYSFLYCRLYYKGRAGRNITSSQKCVCVFTVDVFVYTRENCCCWAANSHQNWNRIALAYFEFDLKINKSTYSWWENNKSAVVFRIHGVAFTSDGCIANSSSSSYKKKKKKKKKKKRHSSNVWALLRKNVFGSITFSFYVHSTHIHIIHVYVCVYYECVCRQKTRHKTWNIYTIISESEQSSNRKEKCNASSSARLIIFSHSRRSGRLNFSLSLSLSVCLSG